MKSWPKEFQLGQNTASRISKEAKQLIAITSQELKTLIVHNIPMVQEVTKASINILKKFELMFKSYLQLFQSKNNDETRVALEILNPRCIKVLVLLEKFNAEFSNLNGAEVESN
jgi:hypothetical protein